MRAIRSAYTPGIFLFIVFFIIGLAVHRDFGVAWDEPLQRELGQVSYDYLFHGDKSFLSYHNKDYGVAFELVLIGLERGLGYTQSGNIYALRHMVTHTFFLLAALCAYVLFYRLFKDRFVAVLGFLMLVCMPRLYAHSFFNSKDIPLLCAVIFCFTAAHLAFEKNKAPWYVLLGACSGFALAIRPTAVLLPLAFTGFLLADITIALAARKSCRATLVHLVLFLASSLFTTYALWPALWGPHPFSSFVTIFSTFSHFNRWDGAVLFMGKRYQGTPLPWQYVPVWFCITVPELWLAMGFTGIMLLLLHFAKRPLQFISNTPSRHFLLYALFFFLPVIAVIKLHSILYNDWRHLYFIYPAFLLLALYAINRLMQAKLKKAVITVCLLQLAMPVSFLVYNHPFGQLYFNHLVSHKPGHLRKNYELDYWGCSYKQAFEYLLAHDTARSIRVLCMLPPVQHNADALAPAMRARIELTDVHRSYPYYWLTTFEDHPGDFGYPGIYHDFKAENSTFCRIYKCYGPEKQ